MTIFGNALILHRDTDTRYIQYVNAQIHRHRHRHRHTHTHTHIELMSYINN
jgi:hypothetical protein